MTLSGAEEKNGRAAGRLLVPASVFLAALVLRLLYILDVSDSPFFTNLIIDLKAYDVWAKEIAAGNWIGDKVFYQSPLYPYFLAVIYRVFGRSLVLVYIIQAVLGALDCILIYAVGKEVFGRRAGTLAGFGAALYKMFIFYQALVLKTFLGVLLIDLSLLLLLLCRRRERTLPVALLAGVSLGLAALVRDNTLALIPFFGAWLFLASRGENLRGRLAPLLLWSLGLAMVLGLSLGRNHHVGQDWVVTTSQGGQNFYIGNHRKNHWGTYEAPAFVRANPEFEEKDFRKQAERLTGRKDFKPSELSRFWYARAFEEIRADPGLFMTRLARKAVIFFNREEVPDNLNYYIFRSRFSLLLRFPLLNFAVAAPLGLLGLLLGLKDRRGVLLALYILVYSGTVILFFVFGRYRLMIMGPLLVFAGYSLTWLWEKLKAREYRKVLPWLAVLVCLVIVTEIPLPGRSLSTALYNLGNVYAGQGNHVRALEAYTEALEDDPENVHILINMGKTYMEMQDMGRAVKTLEKAAKIAPEYAPASLNLGIALFKAERMEQARKSLEKALDLDPENVAALLYLAEISAKNGETEKARSYLERALKIDPENPAAAQMLELLKK